MSHKKALCLVLPVACLISCTASSQSRPGLLPVAPPTFSRVEVDAALDAGVDLRKFDPTPGLHTVPLSDTWSTPEQAKVIKKQIDEQRSRGYYLAENHAVPDLRAAVRAAASQRGYIPRHDRTFHSLTEIQNDILVKPIHLGTSALSSASLLEVRLGGNYLEGKWTGLSRTFEVADLGLVILEERDHAASKDSVTVVQEWVNTDVNGQQASMRTARSTSGRTLVSVSWENHRKLYSLELQPLRIEAGEANQARLLEIARKLVDS
ncbi:hypothetical protein SAMN02800692_3692 [Luteibacter sp. UNC138MFCol5.1]|uniref:hypothetical protein n=1 Tax=Luteibacter sp. UNC138MFCol5.1 TaxID=1502774 RepID=UPI0008B02E6D|nr:hypothetical protein [Luteibacter sp. UNC138MFCol5.1]SEP10374.1 hypothetical protein SAMN02800692_3692 [Luteibacter sp. UNC138MFCol5.1]